MPDRKLNGKRILLTGATSGLGEALAKALVVAGARLLITGRRSKRLAEISSGLVGDNSVCSWLSGDITEANFRAELINKTVDRLGGIDCLVNNAGVGAMGRFDEASADRLSKVFEVNFFAPVELTRLAIPVLKQSEAAMIVNIGSVLGHRAVPLKTEYCASKFALHGWSDGLRAELASDGVTVLHVCPSTIDTPFFDAAIEDLTEKEWKAGGKMSPDFVAQQILKAMKKRKSELVLPLSGKGLVWLDRLVPGVANFLVAKFGQ